MPITPERKDRFRKVVSQRQLDLTLIIENIHDPHNIGAVLRSCDSVGIYEIYVILTDPQINVDKYKMGRRSSSSSRKWIDVRIFTSVEECMTEVRKKYKSIYGTHLAKESKSLYDLDLTESVALMFGNEHDGISDEALEFLDGNFIIPQYGMVKSLNISVACAVSVYEACRQRIMKGMYDLGNTAAHDELLEKYLDIHEESYRRSR